jgi:phosphohistidine phosphatase SixA
MNYFVDCSRSGSALRPMVMKMPRMLSALGILLILLLVTGCASRFLPPEGTTTTVVLLRHAERTTVTKQLTEGGRKRAAALPAALADIDIDAIYSPDLVRNIDTVKPLAAERNLTIILVAPDADTDRVTRKLLSDHPGGSVLWVGNKANLDGIYSNLGGSGKPPVEYGDLFILRVSDHGEPEITKKHYGSLYFE